MRKFLLALALICFGGGAHATCPVIPFIFTNGTPINATQVNDNFSTLRDCITSASGLTQVSSSSALRALAAGLYPMVYRQYNTNPGDGSAFYTWTPGSSCTDDGLNCIKPATNPVTGRWVISAIDAGNMTATGNATVGGTATITGAASVGSDFSATGNMTIGGNGSISGIATVGGSASVTGDFLAGGTSTLVGPVLAGAGINVTNNTSIIVDGDGGVEIGGVGGPFLVSHGALDTLQVQSQPGAGPSGDTTNFQLTPPAIGAKAFLNIARLIDSNPANEDRFIVGTDGNAWIFGQTLGGAGTCKNMAFLDGQSANPAWSMICGSAGSTPSFAVGKLGAILGETSTAFVGIAKIDGSDNLIIGEGASIGLVAIQRPLHTGTLTLTTATPTVGAGEIGFGTTTAAAANCNSGGAITPTACLVVDLAGTPHYVPYF